MYMNNIISNYSTFEDLVRIVNSLNLKINDLEKKINVLQETNSVVSDYTMSNEVILNEHQFKCVPYIIPINAPPLTRQNAFGNNL